MMPPQFEGISNVAARVQPNHRCERDSADRQVYFFGAGKSDGDAKMRNLLGGKGANLAEMAGIGLPVPPGFTITTEVCRPITLAASFPEGWPTR